MTTGATGTSRTPLPGSERAEAPGAIPSGTLDPASVVSVTVLLRRAAELPRQLVEGSGTLTADELGERYGAKPEDAEVVQRLVRAAGLTVVESAPGRRSITVRGSVSALSDFFGVTLTMVESDGPDDTRVRHRQRTGAVHVPAELAGVVVAVLGLDDRPQARAHTSVAAAGTVHLSYTPLQLGSYYAFPKSFDGTGQDVAVIELGGGFAQTDLDAYFTGLGVAPAPVRTVTVDGGSNVPGADPQGADGEVLLDLEVIGALAPGAQVTAVFAPNTDKGFVDAISTAAHASPAPTAISISWGGPEPTWTAQGRAAMDAALADAAALGVTVTVAAGDSGSTDGDGTGAHVDFPAASPHALACGGTRLVGITPSPTGATVMAKETVWGGVTGNGATGGGVSADYPLPAWQARAGVPKHSAASTGSTGGRGVPDVAGDADPQTGYAVRIDGSAAVIGGTSAVAPLWAALVARLAQALGHPLGLLAPLLYDGVAPGRVPTGFHDITGGSNGAYRAAAGWDPCTGLGTPNGAALLTRLSASAS